MTDGLFQQFSLHVAVSLSIVGFILLSQGCSNQPEERPPFAPISAPSGGSAGACIDVEGRVLGDIIPRSNVSLYETSSVNYSVVMKTIREAAPAVKRTTVSESKGFSFSCLDFGQYAFVIPTSSYNGSVGFPLPYEFDCPNISVDIAFQGGDYQYAVGAFSINNTSGIEPETCIDNPLSCSPIRGSLYKNCPFHLE